MTVKKAGRPSGKPINVYVGPEDVQRVRELAAWVESKGHRVSDSQIIKATLIVVKPGKALLDALGDVFAKDLRYRR